MTTKQLKMFGTLALGGVALLAVAAIAQQPTGIPTNSQLNPELKLYPPAIQARSSGAEVETRAYPVAPDQLQTTAAIWKQKLGPSASIAVDPRGSRILVSGPAAIHQVLQGPPATPANTTSGANLDQGNAPVLAPDALQQQQVQQQAEPTQYRLQRIDSAALLTNLQRMWGERVSVSKAQDQVTSYVVVNSASGNRAVLATNSQAASVTFYGTTSQQRAWRIVTEALDVGGNAESTTQLVPAAKADPTQVRQAVAWLQNGGPNTSQIRFGGGMLPLIFGQQPPANGANPPADNSDPPNVAPNQGNPAQGNPNQPAAVADGVPVGDVQVEFIEGLDLMVLRGRKADVERITRVIQEIERVSNETRPEIKVRYLKHANSEAVAEIITTVYENLLTTRLGETSITGLGKPNAILIVGRTENMPVVEDLIAKLDQPVPFPMQFEVFQLREMSSIDMSAALTTAFAEPTGLATRVRVTPIFRSNLVVVQASQRDLLEVGRLIQKLDIRESASVSEVKIFRLQNTLAEDLAPLLQDAINWQLIGDGTPLGNQGGGAGNNQEERARLRSTMLQFLTVDSGGNRLLKSGILAEVRVTADIAGNSLVVTGPSESMTLIAALVNELDSLPSASAQVKVFTIINGDATRLSTMLQTMFSQSANNQGGQQAQGGLGQLGLTTGAGA
ncbi:MAG: general secretion pathway protein D, partial [Pirellulaceae bacterium]